MVSIHRMFAFKYLSSFVRLTELNDESNYYSKVLEEAKWSRGDRGRPARAHEILVMIDSVDRESFDRSSPSLASYVVEVKY